MTENNEVYESATICPICESSFKDILSHISVRHNIRSIEEFNKLEIEIKEKKKKIKEFKEYTEALTLEYREGRLSGEELRR